MSPFYKVEMSLFGFYRGHHGRGEGVVEAGDFAAGGEQANTAAGGGAFVVRVGATDQAADACFPEVVSRRVGKQAARPAIEP